MSRSRVGPIYPLLLSAALIVGALLVACAADRPSREASAHYLITLAGPGQPGLDVRARFTGLAPGPMELAMWRQWAGYGGLEGQLSWIRLGSVTGPVGAMPRAQGPPAGLEQEVLRWSVQVPQDGLLQLTYHLELAGQDGEVPSRVGNARALLLARSLFVFPLSWLEAPQAPFAGSVEVQIAAPAGWAAYAPWPAKEDGSGWLPATAEDLFDAAIALGDYAAYELRDEGFRAHVLLPPSGDEAYAHKRAGELAQGMLLVHRLFGAAPNPGAEADLMAIVIPPEAAPSDQVVGMALGDNLILAQASAALPSSLDEALVRETVRLWMAHALRTAPRWSADPYGREPWLTYGWTDYLAWRIRLDSGQLSRLQYWDHLRRMARALGESPLLDKFSLAKVVGLMRDDPDLAQFVRAKSHLGALLLDRRLQAETGGRIDLSSAARQAHRQLNYYATGSLAGGEQLVGLLGELTGNNYVEFYTQLMYGSGPLDLSGIPELAGPPVGETRTLATPDGLRLFYQWLDGPSQRTAIYLGSGPGRPPYDLLQRMAEPLQQNFDLAYLEQRGSGRSQAPGQGAYSLDAYINDIELLREQLGAAQVTLIGHAWGGFCALHYAQRYPEKVRALILLAPIPSFPRAVRAALEGLVVQASKEEGQWARQVWQLAAQGVHTYEDLAMLSRLMEQAGAYGSNLAAAREAVRKAYEYYVKIALLPEGLSLDNESILPVLIARDGLLRQDLLSELVPGEYPTLILHGERDQAIPIDLLHSLRQRLGAELKEVPNAGHYLYLDNPEAVWAEIASFLERH